MPLVLLGLIAIVAAMLLIYYSRKPGSGASVFRGIRRVDITVAPEPEKRYRKSEDGKVVYLFDDDDDDEDADSGDDVTDDGSDADVTGSSGDSPPRNDAGDGGASDDAQE